ncbi:MAG: D-glycero-beta-D-manno-heptose 1-phosphate adenylyltransferase [Candidatus Glassbacteria bacterium]|nr:D-glycero-beta-D-manno-heptose 1-phosphate adenylyltransferase [Candidatus Glassbacteria bacterium]
MSPERPSSIKPAREKVVPLGALLAELEPLRAAGRRVVFTNGCFDILHPGHILYMEDARNCGDLLVVGLNSDDSVRRLKGPTRPLNPQEDRAVQLAGLASVDYVVYFTEDTPLDLIRAVKPDVLVKGGDWTVENIVGADFVMAGGGKVHSLPFRQGYSTTGLIEKIRTLKAEDF